MGKDRSDKQHGFALVLVLGILLVAASIAATLIARQETTIVWNPVLSTKDQLQTVDRALIAYQRKNHRLPLPAARTSNTSTHIETTFELGKDYALPDQVVTEFLAGATSVLTPSGISYVKDPSGNVVAIGAIPTQTLGLPRRAAEDAEGKFLTYAVTFTATNPLEFSGATGAIDLVDSSGNSVMDDQFFVVLSHGADAKGGWSAKTRGRARLCEGTIIVGGGGGRGADDNIVSDLDNCDEADARFVVHDLNIVAGNQYFDDQMLRGLQDQAAVNQNKPCLPQTISWTVGGNTCFGAIPAPGIVDNSTDAEPKQVTIVSTGASIGSATVECDNGNTVIVNSSCAPPAALSCTLPWGGTIANGASITAYDETSASCGGSCTGNTRTCVDGTLTGSGDYESCAVMSCNPCPLPWGGTINHGESVQAYSALDCAGKKDGSVSCPSETRVCNNGILSGSYTNQFGCFDHCATGSCSASAISWTVNGNNCSGGLPAANNNAIATATDNTTPSTGSKSFICNNGSWSAQSAGTCTTTSASCNSITTAWTINANNCYGLLPSASDGASATAFDNVTPTTGSRSYSCNNGTWLGVGNGTCSTSNSTGNCPAGSVTWTVNTHSCNTVLAETASGGTVTATDATAPTTGSRNYVCNNGSWSAQGTGTCTVSSVSCGAATLNWTVNGNSCSGSVPTTTSGGNATATDSTTPTTGSRGYVCNNGSWQGQGTGSCATANASCQSSSVTWDIGSNTCSAVLPATNHNGTRTATDGSGTIGSRTYLCNDGEWVGQSVGTCSAPSGTNSCPTQNVSWMIDNISCSASAASGAHGDTRSVSDSATPGTGNADFTCQNGSWQLKSGSTCVASACPLPWGGTLAHGQSVTAYNIACDIFCDSEVRNCNNGTLSGSFISPTCISCPGGNGSTVIDPHCGINEECDVDLNSCAVQCTL